MGRNRLFDLSTMSRRELAVVLACCAVFLVFQATVVGILPAHYLMVGLFIAFYTAHPFTRKLALALMPFILFEVCYDWMRLYPNYRVNPVDIEGLFRTEQQLFGITTAEGTTIIPSEYFSQHHSPLADLLAGICYLCWVPLPMAFGLYLFFKGERRHYLHFALCFLFVNLMGFVGYYIHPAAPPWYALEHGFQPDFSTPGNVAGLIRFDEMVGIPVFQGIYVGNSNIFAAVPSLHAAYMLITTIYAAMRPNRSWAMVIAFALVTIGIWWTAVYSCHHYIVDVILGILTAIVGVVVFERLLMRWSAFARFIDRYAKLIAK